MSTGYYNGYYNTWSNSTNTADNTLGYAGSMPQPQWVTENGVPIQGEYRYANSVRWDEHQAVPDNWWEPAKPKDLQCAEGWDPDENE